MILQPLLQVLNKMEFNNIILASASPRRRELLKMIFDEFSVLAADIEEIIPENIKNEEAPEYLARLKACHIAKTHKNSLVIGSDTAVFLGDKILGKPKTRQEAKEMLLSLSGNVHKVITGCALVLNEKIKSFSVVTEVEFLNLTDSEIEEYINSDELYDKAGGYGIQQKGGLFVKKINGDYFNVVGLPVAELNRVLKNLDF